MEKKNNKRAKYVIGSLLYYGKYYSAVIKMPHLCNSIKPGFSVFTPYTYTPHLPVIYISFQEDHIDTPHALMFPTNLSGFYVSSSVDLMNSGFVSTLPKALQIQGVGPYYPALEHHSCILSSLQLSQRVLCVAYSNIWCKWNAFLCSSKTNRGSLFWLSVWVGLCRQMICLHQDYRALHVSLELNNHLASWHLWTPSPQPLYLF